MFWLQPPHELAHVLGNLEHHKEGNEELDDVQRNILGAEPERSVNNFNGPKRFTEGQAQEILNW